MRSGGDFVKVVDFGLAKIKQDVQSTGITSPGIVCGTPDYMAPEQGRGDPIDARSDLYACGVILFQLLTGRLPFEADSPTQVVLMHLSIPPPNPGDIAPEREIPQILIDRTIKALAKDAAHRFQSADEFATTLRNALTSIDATSQRVSFLEMAVTCGSCGALVPKGQKFCGDCGARVNTPSHASQAEVARHVHAARALPVSPACPCRSRRAKTIWNGSRRVASSSARRSRGFASSAITA